MVLVDELYKLSYTDISSLVLSNIYSNTIAINYVDIQAKQA